MTHFKLANQKPTSDRIKTVPILFIFILFLTSCGSLSKRIVINPESLSERSPANVNVQKEIDTLATPLIQSHEVEGLAIGVIMPDGGTFFQGYGKAHDAENSEAPQADTIFQIGSLTKVFLASLYSVLVDEGTLTGAETVRSIIPASIPLSADAGAITLHQLATHTSGLAREPARLSQLRAVLNYEFTGENLYSYIDEKFMYEYLSDWEREDKSQDQYLYSNVGYGLLGYLLELKTKTKLDDLLHKKVFAPMKLKDTGLVLTQSQKPFLADGHVGDSPYFVSRGTPQEPWNMGQIMQGTGALYSSVNDLLRFAKLSLNFEKTNMNPILLSTHKPYTKHFDEDAGLTWLTQSFDEGHIKITYIHGMVSGYTGYLAMNDESKIAVVVLGNSFNWNDKIGHNLMLRLSYGINRQKLSTSETQTTVR